MNRYLESGYRFSVKERTGEFEIKELIGRGASCVVYRAEFVDEHGNRTEHLLKEYNPKQIDLFRNESGALCVDSEEDEYAFASGLHRFQAGYEKQASMRLLEELKNPTSNIQGIYHANGTQYIDMTPFCGQTYDKVQEKSVYELLRRMRAVTQVIGNYHNAGFLHLDIKPENIYTIPETCEMVMLFDFDSVTEIQNIPNASVLSYTKSWAAPEQIIPGQRKNICKATDLFAVGEMIFHQLMGRHSTAEERRSFSKYEFNLDTPIFENLNPRVLSMLEDLLHHTICGLAKQRYESAEKLIANLDEIIKLANPEKPYLKSSPLTMQDFFVGRDGEIREIHEKLSENRILFLNGIGGIGKSELAKHYAETYKSEYDTIVFAPYVSDVNMLLQDDTAIPLYNFAQQYPEEKPEEYCARKIKELQKLCNERVLLIVDNLDRDDDSDLKKLLGLGCKFLITTRIDFSKYGKGKQLTLDSLRDRHKIRKIFDKHYTDKLLPEEDDYVEKIIDLVAGHTMTVELIAKQVEAEWATIKEVYDKLSNSGLGGIGDEEVDSGKDDDFVSASTHEHIKKLFDLSVFEKSENQDAIYILANLSLIPYTGIDRKLFARWCELDQHGGKNQVNRLLKTGWIRFGSERNCISLHPVVAEVVQTIATSENFSSFFKNLTEHINSEDEGAVITVSERTFLEALSLQIIRAIKRHRFSSRDVSSVLLGIGNLYYRNIKFDMAEQAFKLSLAVSEESEDVNSYGCVLSRASVGLMLTTMGGAERNQDKILEGIDVLNTCLELFYTGIDGHDDLYEEISTVYNYLAMAYEDLPDINKALEMYEKGKRILEGRDRKQTDDYLGIAIFYNNIGHLYDYAEKDYDRACENYEKALNYYRKINNESPHIIKALYHLGLIYADETYAGVNLSKANNLAKEALPIAKKLFDNKHPLYIHSLYLYGKTEFLLGNSQIGKESLAEAFAVYKDNLREDHPTLVWLRSVLE